jgi:23S rRNA pseudoU1915 N3-methylase RlmH
MPDDDTQVQRDAALRRVGRNVVNFQRLEAALRALVPAMRLSGPMRDLPTRHALEVGSLKKRTLGDLTAKFQKRMRGSERSETNSIEPEEPTLTLSMQYKFDAQLEKELKTELLSLVKERNRLIHSDFLAVDFSSSEACIQLSRRLDEQNDRVTKQLSLLQSLTKAHVEAMNALARFVASEEFAAQLGQQDEDA